MRGMSWMLVGIVGLLLMVAVVRDVVYAQKCNNLKAREGAWDSEWHNNCNAPANNCDKNKAPDACDIPATNWNCHDSGQYDPWRATRSCNMSGQCNMTGDPEYEYDESRPHKVHSPC